MSRPYYGDKLTLEYFVPAKESSRDCLENPETSLRVIRIEIEITKGGKSVIDRVANYLRSTPPQKYFAGMVSGIGLLASLIQLYTFFGAISTPQSGSNFYINSREFLSWTLIAWIYLFGLLNATLRRRWRRLYGDMRANNSVSNFFSWITSLIEGGEANQLRGRNFKRDFSIVYAPNFIFIFLYSRAVSASESAIGVTSSAWGDMWAALGLTLLITIPLMIVTSMFDFTLSVIWGD